MSTTATETISSSQYFKSLLVVASGGKSTRNAVKFAAALGGGGQAIARSPSKIVEQAREAVNTYLIEMSIFVGTKEIGTLEDGTKFVKNAILNVTEVPITMVKTLSTLSDATEEEGEGSSSGKGKRRNSEKSRVTEHLRDNLGPAVIAFLAAKGTFNPSRTWILVDNDTEDISGVWVSFPKATEEHFRSMFQIAFADGIARALDMGVKGGIHQFMVNSGVVIDPSMARFCFAKGHFVEDFAKIPGDVKANARTFNAIMKEIVGVMGERGKNIPNAHDIKFFDQKVEGYEEYSNEVFEYEVQRNRNVKGKLITVTEYIDPTI